MGLVVLIYFTVISFSFCLCLVWLLRRAKLLQFDQILTLDIAIVVMNTGFIGARILHVFFEAPEYYIEAPRRVLQVWRGGFVWYGGLLISIVCGALALKLWFKKPLAPWLDLFAPIGALGYSLGRVACWITGCCYGAVCTLLSSPGHQFHYPTQAFAVFWELAAVGVLLACEKRPVLFGRLPMANKPGQLFLLWMILHSLGRITMEQFRGDDRGPLFAGSLLTQLSTLLGREVSGGLSRGGGLGSGVGVGLGFDGSLRLESGLSLATCMSAAILLASVWLIISKRE
jgi:phosphatidylglycerol:prolipoprotein diacylglycerol transferase